VLGTKFQLQQQESPVVAMVHPGIRGCWGYGLPEGQSKALAPQAVAAIFFLSAVTSITALPSKKRRWNRKIDFIVCIYD